MVYLRKRTTIYGPVDEASTYLLMYRPVCALDLANTHLLQLCPDEVRAAYKQRRFTQV